MPFIALALIIAAALGGGVSVAAQSALPGDALWGFKTSVNESLEGTFASGEQAKADLDIALVQARLDEAAKLATQGSLNANAQADIRANFDAHAQNVAEHVARLQADGNFSAAADVAARFQAAVANRASVLSEARTTANANAQAALGTVLGNVQATLDAASQLSANASAQAATHADTTKANTGEGSDTNTGNASSSSDTNVHVQTGTSVKGGQGGIKVDSETGSQIGI